MFAMPPDNSIDTYLTDGLVMSFNPTGLFTKKIADGCRIFQVLLQGNGILNRQEIVAGQTLIKVPNAGT